MVLVAEGEEKDERGWKWWWFVFFASFSFHAQCFNATFTLSEVGSSAANRGVFFPLPPNPPFFLCLHQDVLPVHIPYASLVLHVATFCYLDASYEHANILFSP